MKLCSIYRFTSKCSGKVYIGQTSYPMERRISSHLSAANAESRYKFHRALRKYGLAGFIVDVIFVTFVEDMKYVHQIEKHFISEYDSYRNGYNSTEGGQGSPCSIEKARKISAAKKGRPLPHMIGTQNTKGWKWHTNGIDNLLVGPDQSISEGYRRGRVNKPEPRLNGTKRPTFPNGYNCISPK